MEYIKFIKRILDKLLTFLNVPERIKTSLISFFLVIAVFLIIITAAATSIFDFLPGLRGYFPWASPIEEVDKSSEVVRGLPSEQYIINAPCSNFGQSGGINVSNCGYVVGKYIWENKNSWNSEKLENEYYKTNLKFRLEDLNSAPPTKVCLEGTLKGSSAISNVLYKNHITTGENGRWCVSGAGQFLELNVYTKGQPTFIAPLLISN